MSASILPLFPLNMVAFPQEKLPLHIFEPRYKQLINECIEEQTPFGIPAYLNDRVERFGTQMRIVSVIQRYEDGRMDVETEGVAVFELHKFENPAPGKLYAAGEVTMLDNETTYSEETLQKLMRQVRLLYGLLQTEVKPEVTESMLVSWQLAHKVGLTLEQEYELLQLTSEAQRQEFLLNHLNRAIPIVAGMERAKERIKMNGHFRHFNPLNF